MFVVANFLDATATVLDVVLWLYMWIVIARAVISWVNPDPYNPIVRTLYAVTEPVLSRLRRKLPLFAGSIDFSPIVVILGTGGTIAGVANPGQGDLAYEAAQLGVDGLQLPEIGLPDIEGHSNLIMRDGATRPAPPHP